MVNSITINSIVNAKVIKITKTYILAMFDGFVGLCHISNVSDYIVKNLANFFVKNKNYNFLIIEKKANQIFLSYKAIHPKYLKWHKNVIPTPSGFTNLKKNLIERLKNMCH